MGAIRSEEENTCVAAPTNARRARHPTNSRSSDTVEAARNCVRMSKSRVTEIHNKMITSLIPGRNELCNVIAYY